MHVSGRLLVVENLGIAITTRELTVQQRYELSTKRRTLMSQIRRVKVWASHVASQEARESVFIRVILTADPKCRSVHLPTRDDGDTASDYFFPSSIKAMMLTSPSTKLNWSMC
jgi:hypothetical protein